MKIALSAREAAAELGVGLPTLYAYVSRGMLRSEPEPGSRRRLYSATDVRALKARHAGGAAAPRQGGDLAPIESALTLIHEGRLYYRGVDVEGLARTARLESVATLLWDCGAADPFAETVEFQPVVPESLSGPVMTRLLIGMAAASDRDLAAHARSSDAIARTGARILRQAVASVVGANGSQPVHLALASGWSRPESAETIRAALVLTADHELAASTYAVRVAASTGASPWRAVSAGLACLDGPRHGGMAERVADMLDAIPAPDAAEAVLAARLRRGESLPGFGHPLYPDIDPRARLLLALAAESARDGRHEAVAAAARRLIGRAPNLDFGLVVACRSARLPDDAPLTLFALGRIAGWVAHIIEQSRSDRLIRPRTRYTGPLPS
jgi:citrate synthase